MRLLRLVPAVVLNAALAAACATPADSPKALPAPPTPPGASSPSDQPTDEHLADVKALCAEQMGCDVEGVVITCTARDSTGDCVAVHAVGCQGEKTMDYRFGEE